MAIETIVTVSCDTCDFKTTDNTKLHCSSRIEKGGTALSGHSGVQSETYIDMCGNCAREYSDYANKFLYRMKDV